MLRRAIVLAAFSIALLGVSLGMAATGRKTIEVPIVFPPVDTTSAVMGDLIGVSTINDSLWFASPPFACGESWSRAVAHFAVVTKDTATETGLCADSVKIIWQTRVNTDSALYWRTIGATSLWPLASFDSTGTAAARVTQQGTGGKGAGFISPTIPLATGFGGVYRGIPSSRIVIADADSAGAMGSLFRFLVLYNAEEDSLQSHAVLNSGTVIDILDELVALVEFKLR